VALEAMAAGTPVVASDSGGLREVVVHDVTGTSQYAGNPESLAWAILRVFKDPARARRLARTAGGRLAKDFDWRRLAEATTSVYGRVWSEFLDSYWAERTLWPVSPGADQRAEELGVRRLAERGEALARPLVPVTTPSPDESVSFKDHEQTA
jgi:hypothetical protein